jgi:hypothetical protein
MSKSDRLKQARVKAGFKRATLAATYLGIPYGTYSGHEAGSRGIRDDDLRHYAKMFKVPIFWLAFGDTPLKSKIELIGAAGAEVKHKSVHPKIIEVDAPFPIPYGTKALIVTTDEFEPMALKNYLVLIDQNVTAHELVECHVACLLKDQILLGKLLKIGADATCHIQLPSGEVLLDQTPIWIAKIKGMILSPQGQN